MRHPEVVTRLVLVLSAVALAGCGGGSAAPAPTTALLTAVKAAPKQVEFRFRSAPLQIKAGYVPRSKVVESGSGRPVKVAGSAFLVVRFSPASGADLSGKTMRIVYKGPRRLEACDAGAGAGGGEDQRLRGRPRVGDRSRPPAPVSRHA